MSTGSKVFLVVLVAVLGGVGYALNWVNDQLEGDPGEGRPVVLDVPDNAGLERLGERLQEQEVIRNATAFRIVARNEGLGERLVAGEYDLRTGMSVDEVIAALSVSPVTVTEVDFSVPEGLTVGQTLEAVSEDLDWITVEQLRAALDERLAVAGASPVPDGVLNVPPSVPPFDTFGPEVRQPFEGLLFPETYRVLDDATPQEVLQRMLNQLAIEVGDIPIAQREALQERGLTIYDAFIIASIIERETRIPEERALVSSVIANRLASDVQLQVDATVLYALGPEAVEQSAVSLEDLEVESPYNTYLNRGLPPTPISGFSAASLQAAVEPAETDFRYYVLDAPACDGTHIFAESLEEHTENVAEFREAGRCLG